MPTLKEMRQKQVDQEANEKRALVAILRERIQWHTDQLLDTGDEYVNKWHDELIIRDKELLAEAKKDYEAKKRHYERGGIVFPEIDFGDVIDV